MKRIIIDINEQETVEQGIVYKLRMAWESFAPTPLEEQVVESLSMMIQDLLRATTEEYQKPEDIETVANKLFGIGP